VTEGGKALLHKGDDGKEVGEEGGRRFVRELTKRGGTGKKRAMAPGKGVLGGKRKNGSVPLEGKT